MPPKSWCFFITFMPNKPDKYGIKFWVLVDVKAKYVANITPYLGAQEKEGRCGVPLGESVAIKITDHIKEKGYNICCDSFFTSLPLAEKLQKSKFSLVGTMKKNRRDLSVSMTEPQQGGVNFSKFFWHKNSVFCFCCHIYPPFTRKRIVSLYFGREVRTRLGVSFFEVYGPPVYHIKVGRPVKCLAQGHNKRTCRLVLHNLP